MERKQLSHVHNIPFYHNILKGVGYDSDCIGIIDIYPKKNCILYIVSFFNISKIEQGVTQALRMSMVTQVMTFFNRQAIFIIRILSLMKF